MLFTERDAIKQRMQEIKEERRALHDEYYKLLDRLRELDAANVAGEGFTTDYANLMGELAKAVQRVSDLVPTVSPAQVIESIKQDIPQETVDAIRTEDEPKLTETQERVAKEVRKARVTIEASENGLRMIKPKEAESIVMNIFKEEGIPLSPQGVGERFEAKGYTMKTAISEVIRRLKVEGKVESPSFGFWQVKR